MSNFLTQLEHTILLDKLDRSTNENINIALVQQRISNHDTNQRKKMKKLQYAAKCLHDCSLPNDDYIAIHPNAWIKLQNVLKELNNE